MAAVEIKRNSKKGYACDICPKSYGYKQNLMYHLKVTHGQILRSYEWKIDRTRKVNCVRTEHNNEDLKNVDASEVGRRTYFCNECIYWSRRKPILVKHQLRVHNKEVSEDTTNSVMEYRLADKNEAASVNARCKEAQFMTRPKEDFSRHLNSSKPENEGLKVNLTRFYCVVSVHWISISNSTVVKIHKNNRDPKRTVVADMSKGAALAAQKLRR